MSGKSRPRTAEQLATLSQNAKYRGDPGFYVVNAGTLLAVRGPFVSRGEATRIAKELKPPAMSVAQVVVGEL